MEKFLILLLYLVFLLIYAVSVISLEDKIYKSLETQGYYIGIIHTFTKKDLCK